MAVEGGPFILFPGGPQVQRYATGIALLLNQPIVVCWYQGAYI